MGNCRRPPRALHLRRARSRACAAAAQVRFDLGVDDAIHRQHLERRRAVRRQRALAAVRFAREADAPAVPDELVAELGPLVARQLARMRSCSILVGSVVARQPEPLRQPHDVRVDDEAFVHAERRAEHDVRRLARDARQRRAARPSCCGTLPSKSSMMHARRAEDALGLVAIEAGRHDDRLDRRAASPRPACAGVPYLANSIGVTRLTRTSVRLRREDGRDQQLERRREVELAVGVGIERLEPVDDGGMRAPRPCRACPRGSCRACPRALADGALADLARLAGRAALLTRTARAMTAYRGVRPVRCQGVRAAVRARGTRHRAARPDP